MADVPPRRTPRWRSHRPLNDARTSAGEPGRLRRTSGTCTSPAGRPALRHLRRCRSTRHSRTASPFRKASPAVAGLQRHRTQTPARSPSAGRTTTTPTATVACGTARRATRPRRPTGSRSTTTRRSPSPVDTADVDQTTYTASDGLYPDGTYFWRVQALDAEDNGLTWSHRADLHQGQPGGVARARRSGGALVPGTTPFRWDAAAVRGVVHGRGLQEQRPDVQRRPTGCSRATVKTTAYAPTLADPGRRHAVPVAGPPQRRRPATRARGRHAQSFFSSGAAPSLLSPAAGIWLKNAGALFEWTEVPGAATLRAQHHRTQRQQRDHGGDGVRAQRPEAPGSYTWSVTALRRRRATRSRPAPPARTRSTPRRRSSRSSRPTSASSRPSRRSRPRSARRCVASRASRSRCTRPRARSGSRSSVKIKVLEEGQGRLDRPEGPPEARRLPDPLLAPS